MTAQRYTEAEARELIRRFEFPMVLGRNSRILEVNDALAALFGVPAAAFAGRPYDAFLAQGEQRRMQDIRATSPSYPGSMTGMVTRPDGRSFPLDMHWQRLPATEGDDFTLGILLSLPSVSPADADLTEPLVQAAAALVAARSVREVHAAAAERFEALGMAASFYERTDSGQYRLAGGKPCAAFGPAYADDAVRTGNAVFEGSPQQGGERAYLSLAPSPAVLALSGPKVNARHAFTFSLFARVMGAALANAGMHDASARRLRETQLMLELARATSSTLDIFTVLDSACDLIVDLLDVSNVFITLADPDGKVLRGGASSARHRGFFRGVSMRVDDPRSMIAKVARERTRISWGSEETRFGRRDLIERFGETAAVAFPLLAKNEFVGVALLDETRGPRVFTKEWMDVAEATLNHLALAISNARLYDSLRRSYAELTQTRADMVRQERLAALGELSAVVAHEVRNPLAVIFNAVSTLRKVVTDRPEALDLLDIVGEESDRLNRMVNDLLDLTRPRDFHLEPEDVGKIILESIAAAEAFPGGPPSGRFQFDARVEPALPKIHLDRRLMRQALVNVVVNAMQAMPKGGKVRVKAERERVGEKERVRIDLTDEGPGMPEDVRARIFEPFFTTKAQGTGLGLAVVKRIVDEHQGEVEVNNADGGGTTFTFRLPLLREDATRQRG